MLLTTAIDYTNGAPHIGHAYEKLLADVIARWQRLAERPVFFLTGVDQHGQKIQQAAERDGLAPQKFVQAKTAAFLELWQKLDISYDGWAETTAPVHHQCVRHVLQQLYDQGQIDRRAHRGFYSIRQEQFLTDRERQPDGSFGPEWGEVVELEEENYYFKLSQHIPWLLDFLSRSPSTIVPQFRTAELVNAIRAMPPTDLCISRPKERLSWGIELPFDSNFVTYVWFDALINYITFAGYLPAAGLPDFATTWRAERAPLHIIGKDILVPAHGIYWLAMLHALGFQDEEMPQLLVHGWWNIRGEKMSKSLQNIVDPKQLLEHFGSDALRYYLMRDMATGRDADFDLSRLAMLYNTELANELGNLCNRALNMTKRFCSSIIHTSGEHGHDEEALRTSLATAKANYARHMDAYDPSKALEALHSHVVACNQYAERNKPWELAKDPALAGRLHAVLYHLAESVAHLAVLYAPVVPTASSRIAAQLNIAGLERLRYRELEWGILPDNHLIGTPAPLFPRLENPLPSEP